MPIEDKPCYVTGSCKVTGTQYFKALLTDIMKEWWSLPLLAVILLSVATAYDLRFGIVLLMLIFIIFPFVLFFLYYNYALRPECFYSVVEKCVTIDADGMRCEYNNEERLILLWSSVRRITAQREAFLFYTSRYSFFYLPYTAFESPAEMKHFVDEWFPIIMAEKQKI